MEPRAFLRAHVKNVHKLGMKYMVWFGVPFIGYYSEAYGRFKGKYLKDMKNLDCASLDPRFPEVREYLIETCERILREWDIDGFKFDFIDMFRWSGEDPAVAAILGASALAFAARRRRD